MIKKETAHLLWAVLLAGVLLVHILFTALYLTPDNPLKARVWNRLYAYMDPVFAQNWKLFAPNPVSQHKDLWVRARYVDTITGTVMESDWKNVTRPLVRNSQQQRFSPEGRVIRFITSGIRSYESQDPEEKKEGRRILQRVASTVMREELPPGAIREVQARIVTNTFPRFDKRHQPDDAGTLRFQETEWMAFRPAEPSPAKEWPK